MGPHSSCGHSTHGEHLAVPTLLYGAKGFPAFSALNSDLYLINATTGEATSIGPIGAALGSLAQHPSTGVVYGFASLGSDANPNSLYTINPVTGEGTFVGGGGTEVADISFRSNGVLYAWVPDGTLGLCTVNLATGALTSLGASLTGLGILNRGCGLSFDPAGNLWLFPNGAPADADSGYYQVDPDTGIPTSAGILSGFDNGPDAAIVAAAFRANGVLFAADNARDGPPASATLVTINVGGSDPIIPGLGSCRFGAYIEGVSTYGYYLPDGAPWDNAPYSYRTWDQFETDAAKPVSMLMFGQPNPWTHVFNYDLAFDFAYDRPSIPVCDMATFGTSLATVIAGTYDTQITAWATAAAAWGKPFILRLDAEMNGTWYDYAIESAPDPSLFVTFWQHVHDLFTDAGATNVQWHWCPNVDPDNIYTPLEDLYPGDAYVDWTGMTGYNSGGLTVDYIFTSTYARLVSLAPTKPIMIGETGSVDAGFPGEKVSWTNAFFAALPADYPNVLGFCWFNWRVDSEGDPDWPIESSLVTGSGGEAAFQAGVADAYFI